MCCTPFVKPVVSDGKGKANPFFTLEETKPEIVVLSHGKFLDKATDGKQDFLLAHDADEARRVFEQIPQPVRFPR